MTTPSDAPPLESPSQTERTVSEDRLCDDCGTLLTGRRRQAHFCSDRCRTRHGRRIQATRVKDLLVELERIVAALKVEIGVVQ
jgi:hypothetical protein